MRMPIHIFPGAVLWALRYREGFVHRLCFIFVIALLIHPSANGGGPVRPIVVTSPMSPPTWALLQRQILHSSSTACREFFAKYFDERGWLLCVERWGGDDGPDDAIENCTDWPILHALGGHDDVLKPRTPFIVRTAQTSAKCGCFSSFW